MHSIILAERGKSITVVVGWERMGAKNAAAGETHDGWWVCGGCVVGVW
jgi:hypothetical protein